MVLLTDEADALEKGSNAAGRLVEALPQLGVLARERWPVATFAGRAGIALELLDPSFCLERAPPETGELPLEVANDLG